MSSNCPDHSQTHICLCTGGRIIPIYKERGAAGPLWGLTNILLIQLHHIFLVHQREQFFCVSVAQPVWNQRLCFHPFHPNLDIIWCLSSSDPSVHLHHVPRLMQRHATLSFSSCGCRSMRSKAQILRSENVIALKTPDSLQLSWLSPVRPAEYKITVIPETKTFQTLVSTNKTKRPKLFSLICANQFDYFRHECLIYRHQTHPCTLPCGLILVKPHKQEGRDKASQLHQSIWGCQIADVRGIQAVLGVASWLMIKTPWK